MAVLDLPGPRSHRSDAAKYLAASLISTVITHHDLTSAYGMNKYMRVCRGGQATKRRVVIHDRASRFEEILVRGSMMPSE